MPISAINSTLIRSFLLLPKPGQIFAIFSSSFSFLRKKKAFKTDNNHATINENLNIYDWQVNASRMREWRKKNQSFIWKPNRETFSNLKLGREKLAHV